MPSPSVVGCTHTSTGTSTSASASASASASTSVEIAKSIKTRHDEQLLTFTGRFTGQVLRE